MSRPFRGAGNFSRPENALKRAEELEKVGPKQRATALQTLHDVITSKKHRTWSKTFESIMFKHIDLCVEMKKRNYAKEALMQYRNMCHLVNIASLEEVIKYFLKKASDKAEEAQQAAAAVTLDVEDLEEDASPEDLMLSYVSAEKGKDRTDRELVTPWFRFLWESYRSVLEILRTNPKLESLYCMTANKAFAFCLQYKRTTEFKRLCDILRQHLSNLLNRRDREQPAEAFVQHLESRFEQLRVACELELWGEAFRSVEDIQQLTVQTKKSLRPQQMATYYTRLTQIFAVSDAHLYHAFAWLRLFSFTRANNRLLTPADLQAMATCVLLASLSTLPYDRPAPSTARGGDAAGDQEKERVARMATILGYSVDARRDAKGLLTRQALMGALSSSNVLALVPAEVRAIHDVLSSDFSPLDMCERLAPLLAKLPELASAPLSPACPIKALNFDKYAASLRTSAILRLLRQLSEVYSVMSVQALAALVPFAPFSEVEAAIVDAVKYDYLQVRIDHRAGTVHFGSQQLESDRVRGHMAMLARRLSKAVTQLAPAPPAAVVAARDAAIEHAIESMRAENERALARKTLIERRKEAAEKELLEAEREAEVRRRMALAEAEAAEAQRRKEEVARREKERIEREMEEAEQAEVRRMAEANLKGRKAAALLSGREGERLDKRAVMQDVLSERLKEQQEQERKLAKAGRHMDHLERARREEEAPLLEAAWAARLEEERAMWEAAEREKRALHRAAWETDIVEKHKLAPLVADKDVYARMVQERRMEEFAALKKERERRMKELRERKKYEREVARRHEYVKRCREAVVARMKEIEETRRREAEERKRAEQEERQRKIEEAAARQRARDEEIERRMREEKEALLGRSAAAPAAAAAAPRAGNAFVPPHLRRQQDAVGGAPAASAPPPRDDGDRWGGGPRRDGPPPPRDDRDDRWGGGPRRDGPPPPRDDDRWGGPRRDGPPPASSGSGGGAAPSGGKFVPPALRRQQEAGGSAPPPAGERPPAPAPGPSAPPPARSGGAYVPPSRRGA